MQGGERTRKILEDVDHTKGVMADNKNKMIENMEKVAELQDSTEQMAQSVEDFKAMSRTEGARTKKKNAGLLCMMGIACPCCCPCFSLAALYHYVKSQL